LSWQLAIPLLIVLVEVCALTPWVEFTHGPVQYVADPMVSSGLLFAGTAFFFLGGARAGLSAGRVGWGRAAGWLAVHFVLFALFVAWSVHLSGPVPSEYPWLAAILWVLLASGVALTALLAFVPVGRLLSWLWQRRGLAAVALGLGVALAVLMPAVQRLWPRLHGPATALDRLLLQWTYGHGARGIQANGFPVLGTRKLLVLVTPQCSGLEALAAFGLLGLAVLVARRHELRLFPDLSGLLVGSGLLYLLLALRLYGLMVVGVAVSPAACVGLAHSRVGMVVSLAVTVALLSGLCRLCRREPAAAVASNRQGAGEERHDPAPRRRRHCAKR
jgi:exosortase/archaeosortase family protein